MKRSRREKNSITIGFTFYLLGFLIVSYLLLFFIYPKILLIEEQKSDINSLYNSIETIRNKWIEFSDFKKEAKDLADTTYIREVVNSIETSFYDANLVNNSNSDYDVFLEEITSMIEANSSIKDEKDKVVEKLLPSYSENPIDTTSENLTDFKFINYLESIFETFNLSYSDPIGIKNVVLVEDFSSSDDNSLETNIFYIPVDLSLVWSKKWILNFIHYIENVWNVWLTENDIEILADKVLYNNNLPLLLEWDKFSKLYNIYEHQIIDIEDIRMRDYIDSSYKFRGADESLVDFIKDGTQSNQRYEIDIKLRFYVKWLPNYKLEDFINSVVEKYTDTVSWVNFRLKNTDTEWSVSVNAKKSSAYLKEISRDINQIKKDIKSKNNNLELLYKKALNYDTIFTNIQEKLDIVEYISKQNEK